MDKMKILVVDDESRMRKLVSDFLTRKGYAVIEAADGVEAVDTFMENKDIALIILDVMMPKMNGLEVLKTIRDKKNLIPILMLTAKAEIDDKVEGLDLIRRAYGVDSNEIIEIGGITIDKAAHIVKIDGEEIELSYKEFELLTYFVENKGLALSREKILNNVWNYDYYGDARTIDTHVKKLRKKMGEKGDYIKTIWGMGYKFIVD